MKVTGFTFIRNAIRYDYPVTEAINSILPLCNDFVIAMGNSDDGTEKLIEAINSPKIKTFPTTWDDSLREGGKVLAVETNKAFDAVPADSDWAFYIQGDEVIHEKYLDEIHAAMKKWKDDPNVQGLLFNYTHFFGSYEYVGDSRRWYRREIRVIKNDKNIRSYRDAQGFRTRDNEKLKVKPVNAWVYHYGWVKNPLHQQKKQETFNKMWHSDEWMEKNVPKREMFDYSYIDSLKKFEGTHPSVMLKRVKEQNWDFKHDTSQKRFYTLKDSILMKIENLTGWRVGEYKNYKLI
ncbi:MAG: glycosyltransferase family 2 protein [Cytophagaceae bacterium]|nr:glycosyltransferase family 2 protein [Cytophagaceae bacterium]